MKPICLNDAEVDRIARKRLHFIVDLVDIQFLLNPQPYEYFKRLRG
ncbi:MAG: hypothetical protein IPL46_27275 [Saprospiraceae bacterium]|nr:hypothetical protein [Saprospiraceae bacterium]